MAITEKEFESYMKGELKPGGTFQFECEMCGNCCRKRKEPIIITGVDVYRIAKALNVKTTDILSKHTELYIGDNSHLPVIVLKERLDGSCSFLRKGRCSIQQNKPAVCALYPLGRFYNSQEKKFHYFMNPHTCHASHKTGKDWTLQEWMDLFGLKESEEMAIEWSRLLLGLSEVTHGMKKEDIRGELLNILLIALYVGYDTNYPFIDQVKLHMEKMKKIFASEFHKKVKFD